AGPLGARLGSEEEKQERERQERAVGQRHGLEVSVAGVKLGDLAAVPDGDTEALDLADEVVRHRLAQVGATVEKRDERAAAGEPDGRLAGRVAAPHDRDARGAALPRFGRTGRVEDARALVAGEIRERQSPVLGSGGEDHRSRRDLVSLLEMHDMPGASRLESNRAVRGGGTGAEL